jgi:hypothetical protein
MSRQLMESKREEVLGVVFLVLAAGCTVSVRDRTGSKLVVPQ